MSYSVNQYLHKQGNSGFFMSQIAEGSLKVEPIQTNVDSGGTSATSFANTGLVYNSYQRAQSYFIHCEIGRTNTEQVFFVKLMNKENSSRQQFVKKIIVQPGLANSASMMKVDFIFTPIETFDTLVFELQQGNQSTIPHILFRELSEVKNILSTSLISVEKMLKIGVQAEPGLKMCINNEEIQVGKTRVYEIDNDDVQVYYFSVVTPASYNGETATLNAARNTALGLNYGYIHMNNTNNIIPNFILDYVYEEE